MAVRASTVEFSGCSDAIDFCHVLVLMWFSSASPVTNRYFSFALKNMAVALNGKRRARTSKHLIRGVPEPPWYPCATFVSSRRINFSFDVKTIFFLNIEIDTKRCLNRQGCWLSIQRHSDVGLDPVRNDFSKRFRNDVDVRKMWISAPQFCRNRRNSGAEIHILPTSFRNLFEKSFLNGGSSSFKEPFCRWFWVVKWHNLDIAMNIDSGKISYP